MPRLRRIALTVAAMLAVLLLTVSFRYVQSRGVFASVVGKMPGICRTVAGIDGVVAILPDESSRSAILATRQGGIFVWTGGTATKLSGTFQDFHPVALTMSNGKLQAAFARQDGSYGIAGFEVSPGKVTEISRLTTDQLTDPAGIAALPEGRFYLINHHASHTALGRWLDDVFLIPRAEVQFFDSMKFVTVAKRLNAPSSVALSADGGFLYVAQELPHTLASFKRNDFTGALGEVQLLNLPAAPTNITVAKGGSLIVTAWPKRGQGTVYRVRVEGGVPQSAELLYASKAGEIAAAAEANGQLLVGTDKALLACALH
jgi:DNA-binding beta-propeller fold protein YncE